MLCPMTDMTEWLELVLVSAEELGDWLREGGDITELEDSGADPANSDSSDRCSSSLLINYYVYDIMDVHVN